MPSRHPTEPPRPGYKLSVLLAFSFIFMPAVRIGIGPLTLLPEHLSALILLTVLARSRRYGFPKSAPWSRLWLALMSLWWLFTFIASVVVAEDPSQSLRLMVWIGMNLIIAVMVFMLREIIRSTMSQLIGLFTILLAVTIGGWMVAQATGIANEFVESDYASELFRLEGLFDEPNLLAAFIVLTGATMYVFRREVSPRVQWLYLLVGSFGVYLTFTRVAWACWVFVVLAIVSSEIRRRTRWGVAVPLLIVGAAGIVFILSDSSLSGSASDPVLGATTDRLATLLEFDRGTGLTRFLTIESALHDLSRNEAWIGGYGFNGYTQVHDAGVTSYARAYLPTLWVAVFYDGGIFAGIAFVLAVLLAWLKTARSGTTLFFVSFALLASATNNIWFCFPWALGAVAVGYAVRGDRASQTQSSATAHTGPRSDDHPTTQSTRGATHSSKTAGADASNDFPGSDVAAVGAVGMATAFTTGSDRFKHGETI